MTSASLTPDPCGSRLGEGVDGHAEIVREGEQPVVPYDVDPVLTGLRIGNAIWRAVYGDIPMPRIRPVQRKR